MRRLRVPIEGAARANVCVVCGETENVNLETVGFRPVTILAIVIFYFCGAFGPLAFFYFVKPRMALLPFSPACFRAWDRTRKAAMVIASVALFAPYAILAGVPPFQALGTGLVLLLFPLLFSFGPALLGPVCRHVRADRLDIDIPSEDAAAAIEEAGYAATSDLPFKP